MRQANEKPGPDRPPSRKRIKNEKQSILWHFESMDRVNRALQGTNDLEQMMKDVLDTLLSVFGCDRARLVYPCDPDYPTWQVPMERTRAEYPGVVPIGVELPLDPIGAEVYRILRNTDGPVKFGVGEEHPVPTEMAVAFNVQSFIAMAFYPKVGKPWSFGLHQCSYARAWTPEEERLFQEIGRRLSDTLTSLLAFRNLQESEKQVKQLINASPVAMVVSSGTKERVEWVNDKFIELFGYTTEDMPDVEHWWPLAYPDEAYRAEIKAQWEANVEQAIQEMSEISPMEATVRCKDGSRRHVEFRLSSIGEKHIVTFVDLTERKQAEEALSASEAELRSLINTMTDIIFVGNSDGRFLKIVDTSPSLLYKPSKELLGRTLHEVFPKDQADFFLKNLRQALNTQKSVDFEYSLAIGDKEMWFYATVSPMTDDKTLMVARDITERKRVENALQERERHSQSLLRLSRRLEQAQTYSDVLNAAQDEVRDVTGYQNLWAYFFTPDKKQAKALFAKGPMSDMVMSEDGTATLTIQGDRMMEEFVETKEILVIEDAQTDERTDKQIAARMGNRTLINVPILLFDRHLGSIGTGTFGDEGVRIPTASEREYLMALASHMAVSFDRIHLLDERRQSEQALRENEEKFRSLIEQSAEGVMLADENGTIVEWNYAYESMTGLERSQVLGQPLWEIMVKIIAQERATTEQRESIQSDVLEALHSGKSYLFDAPMEMEFYPLPGKEKHYFHQTIFPIKTEKGYRIASLIEDITERKQMAEALAAQEREFRTLAEYSPDNIARYDINCRTIYVNPTLEKTLGRPASDMLGTIPAEAGFIKEAKEYQEKMIEVLKTGNEQEMDLVLPDIGEGVRYHNIRFVAERGADGAITGIQAIGRDITERKQAEAELRQNREATLQFSKQLAVLQEVTNELSKAESSDNLCRLAVQLGRTRLGFDRVSIWFIDEHLGIMRGSFGTDERGESRDERNAQVEFRHEGLAWVLFSHKDQMALVEHRPLYDHLGREVGVGHNAMAALWDGDEVIGVISVDNLFTGQPISEHQLEVLRLYATALGHLITRKRAEEELQRTNDLLHTIIEAAPTAIIGLDTEGKVQNVWNTAAEKMLGWSAREAMGNFLPSVPVDKEEEFRKFRAWIRSGKPLNGVEVQRQKRDGTPIDYSIYGSPLRDSEGQITGNIAVLVDITERKQAEEALRASESRFRVLSENAFVGIYIIQDGRLSYVNSTLAKIFGYTPEELTGADPRVVIHPDDHALVLENIRRRIVGEVETVHYEFRGRCKDGGIKNIEVLGGRIDFGGKTAVIGNLMDITDRKHAEDEIARSLAAEKKARKVAEILREANESLSRTLHLDDVLQNLLLYLRHLVPYDSANVMLLEGDFQLHVVALRGHEHWTDLDAARKLVFDIRAIPSLNAVITTQKSIMVANTYEYPGWVRVTGTEHVVNWLGIPIIANGQVIGLYSVDKVEPDFFTDEHRLLAEGLAAQAAVAIQNTRLHNQITRANVELEQRVASRTAQLEEVNSELEAFAYSVSHDLRAPLRHVDGFIELLQKRTKSDLDDRSQHYMEMIADSARKMGILIDDLLSFSRMSRAEMFKSQVDLNELVQGVIQEFLPEIAERSIEWQIGPLPRVACDRAMLRAALVNLVSNALKFTQQRATARIKIGCEKEDKTEVIIFVSDNGVGFDMNYADKLFGVFQRLHRIDEFEGTGIGLANVRRIVNRHSGRVWAEGEVNHGATFYFSLPTSE